MYKVAIDSGHGGRDRFNRGPTNYIEADGTLAMALAARDILQASGVEVVMTREQDADLGVPGAYDKSDKASDLSARAAIANRAKADFFVSIHTNANDNRDIHGTETHCLAFGGEGEKLAKAIQQSVVAALVTNDRGVKASNFAVLRETIRIPAALVEVMFHSNPEEESRLKDANVLKRAGEAIAMGILGHIGLQPGRPAPAPIKARLVVDGQEVSGAAELRDGQLWVWSRGIAEAMGARIDWDAATLTAYVDTGKRLKLPAYNARFDAYQYNVITAAPEQLEVAMIKGLLPANRSGINGGFLDGQLNPLGVVVIGGETVAERVRRVPPRPAFWLRGGIAGISIVDDIDELGGVDFAVGGGPSLLPMFNPENGQYQQDIMVSFRERTAVGITEDGLVKLIVTEPMTISTLASVMVKEDCRQAMALDGGGSTAMTWGGQTVRGNRRANSTAILIREGL